MKLKEYLDANDITYSRAAKRVGISQQYLGTIINGQKYPSQTLAIKLEEYTKGAIKWTELVKPKETK